MKPALVVILATIFFAWILASEAPRLYKQGLGRAWEANQQGYALLSAIRATATSGQTTVYWYGGHTFATLYLKANGLYLNEFPEHSSEELIALLQDRNAGHIIQSGEDERLAHTIGLLKEQGIISDTTMYRSAVWADNSWEEVPVHHLTW